LKISRRHPSGFSSKHDLGETLDVVQVVGARIEDQFIGS
jgi:hypothetical protein